MTINSKEKQVTSAGQLDAGLRKHFTNSKQQLVFGGATYTPASVDAFIQEFIDLLNGVDVARAAFQAKVKVMRAQAPALRTQIRAFVVFVRATFGNQPDVLADFGLAAHKVPAPKTVQAKAAAVQKVLATRKARNTMGTKQKKAVTGTSTATPSTVAAAPAPTGATPAVTGQPTGNAPPAGNVPTGATPPVASPQAGAPQAGSVPAGTTPPTHV